MPRSTLTGGVTGSRGMPPMSSLRSSKPTRLKTLPRQPTASSSRTGCRSISPAARAGAAEGAAAATRGEEPPDRVPVEQSGGASRRARIARAARELRDQQQRAQRDSAEHAASARDRVERSRRGEPVRGRIPKGEHHLAEARAHLDREIAAHQDKLDRHAKLIAAGKKPMGRPPVPIDESTRVARARRVVANAEAAAEKQANGQTAASHKT